MDVMINGAKRNFIEKYGSDWESLDPKLFACDDAYKSGGNARGKLVCCFVTGRISVPLFLFIYIHYSEFD